MRNAIELREMAEQMSLERKEKEKECARKYIEENYEKYMEEAALNGSDHTVVNRPSDSIVDAIIAMLEENGYTVEKYDATKLRIKW